MCGRIGLHYLVRVGLSVWDDVTEVWLHETHMQWVDYFWFLEVSFVHRGVTGAQIAELAGRHRAPVLDLLYFLDDKS
jgi:hypothetical protein